MKSILKLKIILDGITPRIWRRFLVSNSITFNELHNIIQTVMGWTNSHLYSFYLGKEEISVPNEFRDDFLNAKKIKLKDKLLQEKQKLHYVYDFGDNWEHTLIVEKLLDKEEVLRYPSCLAGELACPPEDCGSIPGYYELMEIRKNKNHPEYKERIKEWLGEDYNPELFDIKEANKELMNFMRGPKWEWTIQK